jgi:hypothetical protein
LQKLEMAQAPPDVTIRLTAFTRCRNGPTWLDFYDELRGSRPDPPVRVPVRVLRKLFEDGWAHEATIQKHPSKLVTDARPDGCARTKGALND